MTDEQLQKWIGNEMINGCVVTDRELLENAAKAAGMWPDAFSLNEEYDDPMINEALGICKAWGAGWWNPLADDGDALRLAVMIGVMFLEISEDGHEVRIDLRTGQHWTELCDGNPLAATRRAIVRAAAEIGKNGGAS